MRKRLFAPFLWTFHRRWLLVLSLVGSASLGEARGSALELQANVAELQIRGDLPTTGTIRLAELQALGTVNATYTAHGKAHPVTGVPLHKVLGKFGMSPGKMGKDILPTEKRSGYKLVVVATAADGFQAVFSAAEFWEGMGKTQPLIAWAMDGKPLDAALGPLRLVVLTDGEPSRSLHQLLRIDVVDMRKIISPPSKP